MSASLHFEDPKDNVIATALFSNKLWNQRNVWLSLIGPGRVAIQSAAESVEDNGYPIVDSSDSSSFKW